MEQRKSANYSHMQKRIDYDDSMTYQHTNTTEITVPKVYTKERDVVIEPNSNAFAIFFENNWKGNILFLDYTHFTAQINSDWGQFSTMNILIFKA